MVDDGGEAGGAVELHLTQTLLVGRHHPFDAWTFETHKYALQTYTTWVAFPRRQRWLEQCKRVNTIFGNKPWTYRYKMDFLG